MRDRPRCAQSTAARVSRTRLRPDEVDVLVRRVERRRVAGHRPVAVRIEVPRARTGGRPAGPSRRPTARPTSSRASIAPLRGLPREAAADVDGRHRAARALRRPAARRCRAPPSRARRCRLDRFGTSSLPSSLLRRRTGPSGHLAGTPPERRQRQPPAVASRGFYVFRHQAHRLLLRSPPARLRRHLQAPARAQRRGRDRGAHRRARQPGTWWSTSATSSAR